MSTIKTQNDAAPKPRVVKRKPNEALAPADTLSMLKSIVLYMQQAGLTVRAGTVGDGLTIQIANAQLVTSDADRWEFVPQSVS